MFRSMALALVVAAATLSVTPALAREGKESDSDVIYDESKAAPVLKKAWKCLRGKGILLVRGYYSDSAKSNPLFEALFVLNMLLFDPESRTMTISSLEKQICEVGFTITRVARLTERSTLMVARK